MGKSLVLRTCNPDGTSYNGFKWPTSGPVECPDWDPAPRCGHGLHGLLWAEGNAGHLGSDAKAIWQVVEVDTDSIVKIDSDKVKFRSGIVVYSGNRNDALQMVLQSKERLKLVFGHRANTKADKKSFSTTGESAHASTTGYSAHASTTGESAHASTTGRYARASTTGDSAHASTTGYSAHASTTGDSAHASTTGLHAVSMAAGLDSTVQSGEKGCFAATYFDKKKERMRILVGYVGEKGIKPNTKYQVADGKWKEVR
jgi:hypothetical protein